LGLPTNVDTVIVDGRVLRRAGTFTAFDHAKIVAQAREAAIGPRDRARGRPERPRTEVLFLGIAPGSRLIEQQVSVSSLVAPSSMPSPREPES
jgi:hypothetical protein